MSSERRANEAARTLLGEPDVHCARLSRHGERVWQAEGRSGAAVVIKLAREPGSADSGRWLDHEVAATRWGLERGLIARRVLGRGTDPRTGHTAWIGLALDPRPTARSVCRSGAQALEVSKQVLWQLRGLHGRAADDFPVPPRPPGDTEALFIGRGDAGLGARILERMRASVGRSAPCHGDVSFNNVLVGPSLDGVELIDWGDARRADPCLDIAPVFVWLSLWGDLSRARALWAALRQDYAAAGFELAPSLATFLARSALVRAEFQGERWASIAGELLDLSDPGDALGVLFHRVAAPELRVVT